VFFDTGLKNKGRKEEIGQEQKGRKERKEKERGNTEYPEVYPSDMPPT
jgi:hypothetical protein